MFDIVVSFFLLAAASPVFLLVAAAIRMSSPGPALFRQMRVGKQGRCFQLLKFRSMQVADHSGPRITCQNDRRISPVGRILRKWKLDELPQLFNVLRGDMSMVGPRPDLPEFCATLRSGQRHVLELRPGVTGAATLVYRNEERLLAGQDSNQLTYFYVNKVYPEKIRLDLEYARKASFAGDLRILARTAAAIFS